MTGPLSFVKNRQLIVPALLLAIILLCVFILLPLKAQTAGDDYFYAYSVKKSIESGKIYVSEASTAAQVFPTLWAILFSNFFSFSYETLHLSTLVFLPIIIISVYFLSKEFHLNSKMAFAVSLFFISTPYIFQYALTFLTDLPFLALELLALLFFAKGLKGDKIGNLFTASVVSSLAFLTRQIGIFLPLGALVAYIVTSGKIAVSKKLLTIIAISAMPLLTVMTYISIFKEGSVSQYNMARTLGTTIQSLLFMSSRQAGLEVWKDAIYETLEYLWLAAGFFSFIAISLILSNLKRYTSKNSLKALAISILGFATIVLFEKAVYLDKTYLGFPLLLYRYESLFPMFWPYVWKYLVLITFLFLSVETFLHVSELKINRTAIFLSISFLLIMGSTAITGPDPKRYVMALLPFLLIYLCTLSQKLRLFALVTIPILLFVVIDSLQMTKLRYDTNALAQQEALKIVKNGIAYDRVLPNLEYTWALWYTIEDKYNRALKNAGGDRLKVNYPVTPDDQDYLVISKENLRYGNLPQKYILIEKIPFNSLLVSSYLITVKKL